jgi:hypothetical protein
MLKTPFSLTNPEPVGQVAPQALPDKWRVIPDKGIVRELASLAP